MAEDFKSLLIECLQDAYSAETQALEVMEDIAEACASPTLRKAFEQHMQETERQVERLEKAAEMIGAEVEGKECEAMEGLISEAEEILDEHEEGPVRDAALIGAAQKMEHYEIASYGTLCAMAKSAGMKEVADLLHQTLMEEKDTDERLTKIAEDEVNPAALRGSAANDPSGRKSSAA